MRLSIDPLPDIAVLQTEGRSQVDDPCSGFEKSRRDRHGGAGGKCQQHEVRRFDLLKGHKMQTRSIQIRMDVLDWAWRPARHPGDVHMRMSQQDAQRFPSHIAAAPHDTHAYHSVLSSPVYCAGWEPPPSPHDPQSASP